MLNLEYAEQIAHGWNTKRAPFAGFVTKFEVDDKYVQKFAIQVVGNQTHQELWVPAEELAEFNHQFVGVIVIESAYYGDQFAGEIDPQTNLPLSIIAS